ncbi:MAG: hypothetical protein ACXADY_21695 [Candidatus Hodarchaeales archaeon]
MTRNSLSVEVSRSSHHDCLFLITSQDDTVSYCLTLKLWNEPCPPRCSYYKAGLPGSLEKLEAQHYHMNCQKFSRKSTLMGQAEGYCKLYFMREPRCRECNFIH